MCKQRPQKVIFKVLHRGLSVRFKIIYTKQQNKGQTLYKHTLKTSIIFSVLIIKLKSWAYTFFALYVHQSPIV